MNKSISRPRVAAPTLRKTLPAGAALACVVAFPQAAQAQRADENVVAAAEDAFGTSVGRETIGVYDEGNVRGFNPGQAGNFRMEGLYFDIQGSLSSRILDGETIHVGPSAQGYAFPAPTGIVDLSLRPSGAKPVVSAIASTDSFGSYGLEVDAQIPVDGKNLSIAAGVGASKNRYANGGGNKRLNFGVVPHWKPAANIEITGFYHRDQQYDNTSGAVYIPTGNFLPARIRRNFYTAPDFVKSDSWSQTFGVVGRARFGDWTIRTGLFRSLGKSERDYGNLVFVNPDQSTDRKIYAAPANQAGSYSGELRVSRLISDGPRKHLITATGRARFVDFTYGGGDLVDIGKAGLNEKLNVPEPAFNFGPLTGDHTRQVTGGLSYSLAWKGVGEATFGAQRTHYVKRIDQPGLPTARGVTDATLPYATATIPVSKGLSLYGSFVRGLEDAGTAPNYAANANVVLPANRTRQYDAGLKLVPVKGTVMILGYYDIAKPYIALDQANFYRVLGSERHRGIEVSVTSNVTKSLRIVAGGVFQRARVTADPLIAEPVGAKAVGQPEARTRFNINWTLPGKLSKISLDGYWNHDSSSVATVDNRLVTDGSNRIGVGARYRFKLGDTPFTARVQLFNILNAYQLVPIGSGAYGYNTVRNVTAYIAADF